MPKSASAVGEEEMKALVKGLKDNEELSVTRVRELLKVGYTKARRLLDEAMAGTTYVPPVDVPSSTNDSDVISYIQKLIEEKREVKPDILRRDLNIGYKRAKRLIDSMGGNRAGLTVIPPIARKRRVGKKKKAPTATKAVPKSKAATTRKRRPAETETIIADGADIVVDTNKEERFPKRRRAEKRVPKHIEQVYDDDDEEEENGDGIEGMEEQDYHEMDEEMEEEEEGEEEQMEEEELGSEEDRVVEYIVDRRQRKSGVEYLLKWVGLPESENSWSSAADAGCEDLASAFEEKRSQHSHRDHRKHHRRHSSSNSESSHDEAHHEEPGHDESHAHIMMMFHQQGSHSPDEADRSSKEPSHHHGHHHSHHHHSSHHKDGEHGHHEHSHHHHSSHHKDKDVQGHEHGHHHSHHGHHHHSSHHKDKDGHSHGHHSSHHHSSHHHHSHGHGHGHSHGHHSSHHHSSHHHHHHKKPTKISDIISETKHESESDSTIDSQCCSASDTDNNTQVSCDDNCSSVPCDDNCELSPQQTPTITPTISTISKLVSNEDSLPSITSLFPDSLSNTTEVI